MHNMNIVLFLLLFLFASGQFIEKGANMISS